MRLGVHFNAGPALRCTPLSVSRQNSANLRQPSKIYSRSPRPDPQPTPKLGGIPQTPSFPSPSLALGLMTPLFFGAIFCDPSLATTESTETLTKSPEILYTISELGPQTAGALAFALRPIFAIGQVLFIVRIVMTWYPEIKENEFPWTIAAKPTEPVLGPTRKIIPPAFGVDVSPIVWVAVLSFANEILVGPQGILNLIQRKG